MLNSNFCKMFKNRLKLRKVATIVACLSVTTMFVACDKKNGDDDDGNKEPIVGMWRSSLAGTLPAQVGVVFFNVDGTYAAMRYRNDQFNGYKGKYKLNGNTLEVYDLSWFQKHNTALSFDHYAETLKEGWDIIDKGTRNEVLAIMDPSHSFWQYYSGWSVSAGWMEASDWTEEIEWIDADTIDYPNGLSNPLKRVK